MLECNSMLGLLLTWTMKQSAGLYQTVHCFSPPANNWKALLMNNYSHNDLKAPFSSFITAVKAKAKQQRSNYAVQTVCVILLIILFLDLLVMFKELLWRINESRWIEFPPQSEIGAEMLRLNELNFTEISKGIKGWKEYSWWEKELRTKKPF